MSMSDIARALRRSQSTISREVKRNTGGRGYRYKQANRLAIYRHKVKPKSLKLSNDIKLRIDEHLNEQWSPEQIAGRLKQIGLTSLHHETIYQYILKDKKAGGSLYKNLRHQNKTYRKRYGSAHSRIGIPNRVDIDERPEAANKRERVGDWEMDTIIGKNYKGAIVTMDDRKTKLRLAAPIPKKKAKDVKDTIIELLTPLNQFVKTLTFDNGKEFTMHEITGKALDCDTYFCKPYHSWERGQNENANGLLRQYFPKSMELVGISNKQVNDAVDKLNSRPRKCLGYRTPYETFKALTGIDVRELLGYALMT